VTGHVYAYDDRDAVWLCRFQHIEDEIPDPATGEKMKKVVFYVVYVGQQMARRIEKMCDFLRATRYQIPTTPEVSLHCSSGGLCCEVDFAYFCHRPHLIRAYDDICITRSNSSVSWARSRCRSMRSDRCWSALRIRWWLC